MAKSKRTNNLLRFSSIPPSILGITIAASWLGMVTTIILGYPLAIIGVVTILPWLPVFFSEAIWKYRHYAWVGLFEILIITQGLHFIEHIAQIVEVDVVGLPRALSRGIIGNLDAEYVHFFFDTFLLVGVTILLFGKFRKNIALWICWVVAIWHTTEHWYITYFYTFDYKNYDPNNPTGLRAHEGLLGHNGLLWPNSPFQRIELHFLYNLLFTIPLVWAFVLVIRDAYDEYLKKAFPRLSEAQLVSLNTKIESVQVDQGELIIKQGDPADTFYILAKGEVEIVQETGGGQPTVVNRLTNGQFFGEVGLLTGAPRNASVRAVTHCDLLALDRDTFRAVIGSSVPTAQDYAQVLAQRGAAPVAAGAGGGSSGPPLGAVPSGGGTFPPGGPVASVAPGGAMPAWSGPQPVAPGGPTAPTPFQVDQALNRPTVLTPIGVGPAVSQPTMVPFSDKTIAEAQPPQFRPASSGWVYGLVFSNGEQAGQGVVLSAPRMVIGRDLGSEIRLADDTQVSRRHAELLRTETGAYQIRDMGSSNGVFVNGQRLASGQNVILKEDDEVRIGHSTFAVRRVGARVV